MTEAEINELAPELLRIEVAELCGWTNCLLKNEGPFSWDSRTTGIPAGSEDQLAEIRSRPKKREATSDQQQFIHLEHVVAKYVRKPLPKYVTDLNACLEFEQSLGDIRDDKYLEYIEYLSLVGYHQEGFSRISATAEQRCKAFVLTMDGWVKV